MLAIQADMFPCETTR